MGSMRMSPKFDARFILMPIIIISLLVLIYLLLTPPPEKEQTPTPIPPKMTVTTATPKDFEDDEKSGKISGILQGPVIVNITSLNGSNNNNNTK